MDKLPYKIIFLFIILITNTSITINFRGQDKIANSLLAIKKKCPHDFNSIKIEQELPQYFIANHGQVDPFVSYYAKTPQYTLWVTQSGLIFDAIQNSGQSTKPKVTNPPSKRNLKRDIIKIIFPGANKNTKILSLNKISHRVNYLKGKNKTDWYNHIPCFQSVIYKDLFKKVDLKIYWRHNQLEYDWIIKPGGNPQDIHFKFLNIKKSLINDKGDLTIITSLGQWVHKKPISWQNHHIEKNPQKKNDKHIPKLIDVNFKELEENLFALKVGEYDPSIELIIDPIVMVYSSYIGGNAWEEGSDIAIDNNGIAYITGGTWSTDFPIEGQYMSDPGSENPDVFIIKIDTTKTGVSSLLYSTYLGGSDIDVGTGIAIDSSGNVYVTGYTWSEDFPLKNSFQSKQGGQDIFVTQIDSTQKGTDGLKYSSYLGGTQADYCADLAIDSSGCLHLTGWTYSTDFPTKNAYLDKLIQGEEEFTIGFLTKIDPNKSGTNGLLYSTFLGGQNSDGCTGIAIDGNNISYITGWTYSKDFPLKNQYKTHKGMVDAFVTKIDTKKNGSSGLLFSTCVGGTNSDYGEAIALEKNDNGIAYITGITRSSNYPTRNAYQNNLNGEDAFLTKIDTTQSGSSCLLYSTYLGGSRSDKGYGISINANTSGMAYITGVTESANFPLANEFQSFKGEEDAFITQLNTTKNGSSSLNFSTYLGGTRSDGGTGISCDNNGNIYITGWTLSTNFPKLNQFQGDPGDLDYDIFLTKFQIEPDTPPIIQLDRSQLDFSALVNGAYTPPQIIYISNEGGGIMDWATTISDTWLKATPSSGSGCSIIKISIDPLNLAAQDYSGTITFFDENASNSPQTLKVNLSVLNPGDNSPPFGDFSTPLEGSIYSSSIPVTGWVLDDVGVENVKIYRQDGQSITFIGDAIFVQGARPDIEENFPGYPMNDQAGWGYMMLSHFLPNGGNGTYKIQAIARDIEGNEINLGTKSIMIDNNNAVKPFGAIDTPIQGGTAAGDAYINWGWVLTPQPNSLAIDGSSINVWIDGVLLGHPTYNIYRSDIASLFPGLINSDGAAGYYTIDTLNFSNGLHTIQWTAKDNAGNTDGIGSRFFSIYNSNQSNQLDSSNLNKTSIPLQKLSEKNPETTDGSAIGVMKGYDEKNIQAVKKILPVKGIFKIEIKELERVVIHLEGKPIGVETDNDLQNMLSYPTHKSNQFKGYLIINNREKPLPPGSYLDSQRGIFYWQPGPGFIGNYQLCFMKKNQLRRESKKSILITITPQCGVSQ